MCFRIAGRVVRAVVKERAEARRAYEQARSEGRAATPARRSAQPLHPLGRQRRAGHRDRGRAGLPGGARLRRRPLALRLPDGRPRALPRPAAHAPPAPNAPLPPPRLPTGERPPDVAIEVTLQAGPGLDALTCPSHRTAAARLSDRRAAAAPAPGKPVPNRDFVLAWPASAAGVRPLVRVERAEGERAAPAGDHPLRDSGQRQRAGGRDNLAAESLRQLRRRGHRGLRAIQDIPGLGPVLPCRYCGALLAPGTVLAARATRPRDVVVLVDRSASMRGSLARPAAPSSPSSPRSRPGRRAGRRLQSRPPRRLRRRRLPLRRPRARGDRRDRDASSPRSPRAAATRSRPPWSTAPPRAKGAPAPWCW